MRSVDPALAGLLWSDPFSRRQRCSLRKPLPIRTLAAFNANKVDAVIVNVAGCGSMLKDYGHHWHDEKQA